MSRPRRRARGALPSAPVPRHMARRKRASTLLLLGVVFLLSGWVMYDTADVVARNGQSAMFYAAHLDVMPMGSWGVVFMVVGAGAALSALFGRLPAWVGFAALQLLALFWSTLFAASYFQNGYGRTLIGLLQWGAIAGILAIVSDWDDPPPDPQATEAALTILDEGKP